MEILSVLPKIIGELTTHEIYVNLFGCIHVGAHVGQEYSLYRSFGIKNVIFYEPLPDNFEKLKENVGQYNLDLRNIALGNTNGEIEMFLEDRGMSSSVLEPDHHLVQYPQIEFKEKTIVPITRLDDEEFNRSDYNFMNIDVQGYELEVLKGAVNTLEHIDIIIAEINKVSMYKDCPLVGDIDDFLKDYGFQRMITYWQLDGGTWGDGLYVKANK